MDERRYTVFTTRLTTRRCYFKSRCRLVQLNKTTFMQSAMNCKNKAIEPPVQYILNIPYRDRLSGSPFWLHCLYEPSPPYYFRTGIFRISVCISYRRLCNCSKSPAIHKSRRHEQAAGGEDFYFVQKMVPFGGYFNLNSTQFTLRPEFPLGCRSGRVPQLENSALIKAQHCYI